MEKNNQEWWREYGYQTSTYNEEKRETYPLWELGEDGMRALVAEAQRRGEEKAWREMQKTINTLGKEYVTNEYVKLDVLKSEIGIIVLNKLNSLEKEV